MKVPLTVFIFFSIFNVFAQETNTLSPLIAVDSLYREDQFYFGFTYNSLLDRPTGISQNKFSSGFTGGFLRDMPINKKRTFAIATGLGLSYNKIFQNLLISKTNQETNYSIIQPGINYNKNKIDQIFIDIPIEFRWRTSTPESHEFWRIYSGFKFSYLVLDKYVYVDSESKTILRQNNDLNKLRFGAYLACGYNTWNFYAYYGLNPIFKSSAKLNNEAIGLNTLNLGLMFYIL